MEQAVSLPEDNRGRVVKFQATAKEFFSSEVSKMT
jgi:hypothetical protein